MPSKELSDQHKVVLKCLAGKKRRDNSRCTSKEIADELDLHTDELHDILVARERLSCGDYGPAENITNADAMTRDWQRGDPYEVEINESVKYVHRDYESSKHQ